ncbi:SDR family oxidoreductase [Saprospiraceae bacterium]|nr:SDR family oxidoreductase [Saprospiraceae bacterium]|tara:strand:- start:1537 stop:2253 length:717 start_codon:yes stop_codon:yes gene_type:complete
MELQGKTALITGGSKGIGRAIAEQMLQAGMNVGITGRSINSLNLVTDELKAQYGDKIVSFESDVRDYTAQQNAVSELVAKFGGLNVVIANAGIGHFAPIDVMTHEQWNDIIDINLTGVFNTVKASVESIKKSEGYIITIASLAGTNFFAQGSAYNASKFGLVGFTQAIMLDLRKYGVKVSTIMPGSVSTYFNDHTPNDADAWKIQPEDIAELTMNILNMNPRTLPSKIEVRPSRPGGK